MTPQPAAGVRTGYQNAEVCAACGGECCKKAPGAAWPEDFEEVNEALFLRLAESGDWAVDWWEGPLPGEEDQEWGPRYFWRPKAREDRGLFAPLWFGTCRLLRDDGCALTFDERPSGCRMLVPVPERLGCRYCSPGGYENPKEDAARKWLPHRQLFLDLRNREE